MFGLSLVFKTYCATISFMIFILILTPQTLIRSTDKKEASEYHCIHVQASDYFCFPSANETGKENCFGALLASYPLVLGLFCVFAFSIHLWFTFKSHMPNFCDWVLAGFFTLAWFIAFVIMIYICAANKLENYPVPTSWIVATTLCLFMVVILAGETLVMLRKPEYYYGLLGLAKAGPVAVAEPTAPGVSAMPPAPYAGTFQPTPTVAYQ